MSNKQLNFSHLEKGSFIFIILHTPVHANTIPKLFPALQWLIFHIHEDNLAKLDWKVHQRESYPCSAKDLPPSHPVPLNPESPFTASRVHLKKSISGMLQYCTDKLISSQGNFYPSGNTCGVQQLRGPLAVPSLDYPFMVLISFILFYVLLIDDIDHFTLLLGAIAVGAMD